MNINNEIQDINNKVKQPNFIVSEQKKSWFKRIINLILKVLSCGLYNPRPLQIQRPSLEPSHPASLKLSPQKPMTAENLDHFALKLGYGYKSANLMILDSELKNISLENSQLRIPPIHPHSHFEMQEFLLKAHPEIKEKWNAFLDSFEPELKNQYLQSTLDSDASKIPMKLSQKGLTLIEEIQTIIKEHFTTHIYSTPHLKEWLKNNPTEFLIVRSTGKEDSDAHSNAGGNDSIPFVRPNLKEISEAMGNTLASYFGAKSITQRLGSGDRTLFTEPPFIPVLLQVMIGEDAHNIDPEKIPRSGVIFSSQNDKADGVTLIQAALGNNEGVVKSAVAVDSYYIDSDHNIHSIIRKKTSRFIGVETGGNHKIDEIANNNPSIEREAALPSYIIKDLKRMADAISKTYGKKPMDIEYTVTLNNTPSSKPIIYLLQARPLQKINSQSNPPSYLNLNECEKIPTDKKVMMQTLLDGQSYVRKITNPGDVLFSNDLQTALNDYYNKENPENIKAIFIKKSAPSTSHESVILRARGVAVFVIESPLEYEKAETLIKQTRENDPVYLDPQRGLLAAGTQKVIQGFISYPIPLEVTVPFTPIMAKGLRYAQETDPSTKELLTTQLQADLLRFNKTIADSIELWKDGQELLQVKDKSHPNGLTLRNLLDQMATKNTQEAKLAFASLLSYLQKNLAASMKKSEGIFSSSNAPNFMILETIFQMAKKELIPSLENNAPQTLKRLYPLKFLEALIFQQASKNIVGGFSYGLTANTSSKESILIQDLKSLGIDCSNIDQDQIHLYSLKNKIWNEETQEKWLRFIQSLDSRNIKICKQCITQFDQLNMISKYLNFIFADDQELENKSLIQSMQQEISSNLNKEIQKKTTRLNRLEDQIELWKNPGYVKSNFESFKSEFQNEFKALVTIYEKCSSKFEKLALLEWALQATHLYDRTIKSLKESLEFPNDAEKVKYFAELLEGYAVMMEESLQLLNEEDETELMTPSMGHLTTFKNYNLYLRSGHDYCISYTRKTHIGFDKLLTEARSSQSRSIQLKARSEFTVNSLVIGSKADLDCSVHWPNRLEEYFTTFHQTIEKALEFMQKKEGLTKSVLPGFSQNIVEKIETTFSISISQIKQENDELKIVFNVPLRQHAGLLTLIINEKHPEKGIQLEGKLFGANEMNRWDQIAAFISYLVYKNQANVSFTKNIPPDIDYCKKNCKGISFSLQLSQNIVNNQKSLGNLLYQLCYAYKTLSMNFEDLYLTEDLNSTKHWAKNWDETFPIEFYEHSLYINTYILSLFDRMQLHEKAALVAEQSLVSLAKKGLKDYFNEEDYALTRYLGTVEYNFVPNNIRKNRKSLLLFSILYLIKSYQKDENVRPIINRILANEDLLQAFPEHLKALETSLTSSEAIFESYLQKEEFSNALEFALNTNRHSWKEKTYLELVEKIKDLENADDMLALLKNFKKKP